MGGRFQFRLARLLRVREIAESSARAEWAEAQAALAAAESVRDRRRMEIEHSRRFLSEQRESGSLDPDRALLDQRSLDAQLQGLVAARETVLTLEAQAQTAQEAWQTAESERRALAELRERALRTHQIERREAENAELDEIAGMRHARLGASGTGTERGSRKRETDSSRPRRAVDQQGSPRLHNSER